MLKQFRIDCLGMNYAKQLVESINPESGNIQGTNPSKLEEKNY